MSENALNAHYAAVSICQPIFGDFWNVFLDLYHDPAVFDIVSVNIATDWLLCLLCYPSLAHHTLYRLNTDPQATCLAR